MNQPEYILTAGTKIRTNAVLGSTTGIIVRARNIAMRKPNADGEIRSVVGGHGGDVYWVQHDGDDFMAVYSFTEFELASGPMTDPVHPAQGIVNEIAAKVTPGHEPPTVVWTKPDDGRNGLPLGFFDDSPFVYEFTDANGPMRCHPASGVGPLTLHVKRPHVATLPDGRAVNLPAGTVLREGMTWEGPPADPLRDLCDAFKANPDPATAAMISKLREQVDRGASPLLAQALDLLRRARTALDPADADGVLSEVDAFLAGMPIVSEGSQPLTLAELCAWAADEAKGTAAIMGDKLDPYLEGKLGMLLAIGSFVNEPAQLREYMARRGTVAAAGRATFTAANGAAPKGSR